MYPGADHYAESQVAQSARAVVKLDLPEKSFMISLLADIEQAQGSLSLKVNEINSQDILNP